MPRYSIPAAKHVPIRTGWPRAPTSPDAVGSVSKKTHATLPLGLEAKGTSAKSAPEEDFDHPQSTSLTSSPTLKGKESSTVQGNRGTTNESFPEIPSDSST
eukprot:IDg3478t1